MASKSEPVVILYKSQQCGHCAVLSKIWDEVTKEIKVLYPNIRFFNLTVPDNTGVFDENTAPKSLLKYGIWFPMILLVPGKVWDTAMENLGPKNPVEIKDGVQMVNAAWDGDTLKYVPTYDIRKVSEFTRWIKDAHNNDDFKRVQTSNEPIVVPRKIPNAQGSIAPIIAPIAKPVVQQQRYVAASPTIGDDICSMKIISRPR